MSEQKPKPFNFWWPTSKTGSKVMGWTLGVVGCGQFINGCNGERLLPLSSYASVIERAVFNILIFYVALGIGSWYFIFNISRFVYSCVNRTETVQAMKQARREETELRALRRRKELKELKDELGPNDDREH